MIQTNNAITAANIAEKQTKGLYVSRGQSRSYHASPRQTNKDIAQRTATNRTSTIQSLPMTPGLFGGVTGSRAVMGAHICTALCDVTPNMRWTSKAKETQHYERLSPHSAQLYHQETH